MYMVYLRIFSTLVGSKNEVSGTALEYGVPRHLKKDRPAFEFYLAIYF